MTIRRDGYQGQKNALQKANLAFSLISFSDSCPALLSDGPALLMASKMPIGRAVGVSHVIDIDLHRAVQI